MKFISDNADVIYVFISALLILLAAKDVVVNKRKKWYRSITPVGWWLFAITILYCIVSFSKLNSDNSNRTADKKSSKKTLDSAIAVLDTAVDHGFKKHHADFNVKTQTITVLRDTSKEINPMLDVDDDSTRFRDFIHNTVNFEMDFKCVNNEVAYHMSDEFIIFYIISHNIALPTFKRDPDLLSYKSYGNKGMFSLVNLNVPRNTNFSTPLYIYFKVTYYNKEKGGIMMEPLRRIYQVTIKDNPKSISDFSANPNFGLEDDLEVKNLLIKAKYW